MSAGPPDVPQSRASLVAEWVTRAEEDLDMARREIAFAGRRNVNMAGFLLQQAVEKLMKALLLSRGIEPPKIHDLDMLDELLGSTGLGPSAGIEDLSLLTAAAVQSRYPGAALSDQQLADLLRIAEATWGKLRPLV